MELGASSSRRRAGPRGCKRIAVFNYKGGVGKTTLAVNLAATLVDKGYRVALVDFDSQCNATSFLVPYKMTEDEEADEEDEEAYMDPPSVPVSPVGHEPVIIPDRVRAPRDVNDRAAPDVLLQDNLNPNVYTVSIPYFEGYDVPVPELIPVRPELFDGRLWLLAGSRMIVRVEMALAGVRFDDMGGTRKLGFAEHIFNQIQSHHRLDFIIVDCGPNSGSLNRTLTFSCDYILPPVEADLHCLSSANGLLREVMPLWHKWHKQVTRHQQLQHDRADPQKAAFVFKGRPPKLLPFLVINYKMSNASQRRDPGVMVDHLEVTIQASRWVRALRTLVVNLREEVLAPGYSGIHQRLVVDNMLNNHDHFVVCFLREMASLFQISHSLNTPVVRLTEQEIITQTPNDAHSRINMWIYSRAKFESLAIWLAWLTDPQP